MKKLQLAMGIMLIMAFPIFTAAQAKKDEKKAAPAKTAEHAAAPSMEEMMKSWETFMTPGEVHKMMESWNGDWTGAILMWMSPGAEPTKSESFASNTMILGGRYQRSNFKGDFNGMGFEGEGTTAYDNLRKVFVSSWIDNMGTSIMYMEGTWDEKTRTINFRGTSTDPMAGKVVPMRETFQIIDEKTQLMTMYAPDPATGKEFKTMEMRLTKK